VSNERWERMCKGCGQCCYNLLQREDGSFTRQSIVHCRSYDPTTKLCTTYHDRFRLNSNCREILKINIPEYAVNGFLPDNCGYIEAYNKGEL
jgi:uncharacterized cysteine cluster protein YcgN (CxxCxxCC family)